MINKKHKHDGLIEYLEIGDIIVADYDIQRHKIRTAIPIYNIAGKFIGELSRPVTLEICGFKMNPMSGLDEAWIEIKTNIVSGIINPLALIHNFKYVK